MKKITIIGSGLSGLSASCYLAKNNFKVTVIEKNSIPGGRLSVFEDNGFVFDMGPSWYWMPEVFENFFKDFNRDISNYYQLQRLDPSYKFFFSNSEANIPANLEDLMELLSVEFRKKSRATWLKELEKAKIPAGPVLDINEMHADLHTQARDMVVEVNHNGIGPVKTIGCPVKFSETPSAVHAGAPLYAEHTHEVLAEFGLEKDEIDSLVTDGAIIMK